MKTKMFFALSLAIAIVACIDQNDDNNRILTSEINFEKTVRFEDNLSAYNIFQGVASNLVPSNNFHLLELTSTLFTDYSYKQRLVKVPQGEQIQKLSNDSLDFPDGTLLVKTFFYYNDERDTSLGKRIIESRLLIKQNSKWNVATYIWNRSQTDATLDLNGAETQVNWINTNGRTLSTLYNVPSETECMTCHQSNSSLTPIGPKLRNLNRIVERNGSNINQLNHIQAAGILSEFPLDQISKMVDYKDSNASLSTRGRAYLEMNCAHCHNPNGWEAANRRRFDFRYELPLNQTGILSKEEKISRVFANERMPFIGTTMLDEEGLELLTDYLNSLR